MPRIARPLLVACLVGAALFSCGKDASRTATPEGAATVAPAGPTVAKTGPLYFVDMAHDAGITFKLKAGSAEKLWIPETIGQGAMLFDYDNDHDLDLYFANGGDLRGEDDRVYTNSLWRNEGNWQFKDVTAGSGLECPEWSCGVYTVDYDADGWDDVYVTQLGRNRMFRNLEGSGRFEDVTDTVGADWAGWTTSAAFFDADADGDLDLYCCNYVLFDTANPPNQGIPCEWRNLRVCCGPLGLPEAEDVFYENTGGRFVEATEKFGFVVRNRDGERQGSYSLGVVTGDYDRDGDPDVYVAVDSRPNLTFENLGGGRFREVGQDWQTAVNASAVQQAGMGVAAGDLSGDGWIDLFVTNFSHDTNTLYENAGQRDNMYFDDVTNMVGLGGEASFSFLSWGTGIYDFNCDGILDVFVASGHVYPQAQGQKDLGTEFVQPNQLFIGLDRKAARFENRAAQAGPGLVPELVSRGATFGDIDRDGRVDIVVVNLDWWPNLIRNESDVVGGWIGLELIGKNPANRHAVGAALTFHLADGDTLYREVHGGGGYMGANDFGLHAGLPPGATLERIAIRWPDGQEETLPGPALGAWYAVTQGSGAAVRR